MRDCIVITPQHTRGLFVCIEGMGVTFINQKKVKAWLKTFPGALNDTGDIPVIKCNRIEGGIGWELNKKSREDLFSCPAFIYSIFLYIRQYILVHFLCIKMYLYSDLNRHHLIYYIHLHSIHLTANHKPDTFQK